MAAKPKMMATVAPTEQWSVKEKLCLASSVMRSGDQNWVSVSRAIKPFAEPGRQPDYFSQKNCARQYSTMLENVETPKRKRSSERGEVVETPGDLIVRKMTMERIDELKAQIREDKARFKQLKKEIEDIRSGSLDDKLQGMWDEIQNKKKAAEEESEALKSTTESVKTPKSTTASTSGKARRPPSRTSKTSRTSEGSLGEASAADTTTKQIEDRESDSVFEPSGSSSDAVTDKHKSDADKQESNDSVGGAEGSDVDVTAVTDKSPTTSTPVLSKLLTHKGKITPSSGTSPSDAPGSQEPQLSAASKASAAKEAAKILLAGATGGGSEVCGSRGFQSVFSSFLQSDKQTEKKTDKKAGDKKSESKESTKEAAIAKPSVEESAQEKKTKGKPSRLQLKEENEELDDNPDALEETKKSQDGEVVKSERVDTKLASPIKKIREVKISLTKVQRDVTSPKIQKEVSFSKSVNQKDDVAAGEALEMSSPRNARKELKKEKGKMNQGEKVTSPRYNKKQDIPKSEVEIADALKSLDAAEDSDASNVATEPSSPSRPEPSETRGKRKSRGRPRSSARRSGRTRAHTQVDGDETSEERRASESLPEGLDDTREETRSETAESEETERPSESDRDDASSVVAGSLQQSLFADSLPGSPSSVTTEHEHDHTYRIWRKAIMLVWRTIAAHKYANIFLHPVTNDIAPGYCGIVHRPMDLTKIKKNIENGTIRTTEQFHRDILLMFQNAIMYNNRDHDVYQMAVTMQNDAVVYIEEFISTQLMVQQPDSVKMLRSKDGGSRRIDAATPAKQEDPEKQRRGSAETETSGKKRRTRADEY